MGSAHRKQWSPFSIKAWRFKSLIDKPQTQWLHPQAQNLGDRIWVARHTLENCRQSPGFRRPGCADNVWAQHHTLWNSKLTLAYDSAIMWTFVSEPCLHVFNLYVYITFARTYWVTTDARTHARTYARMHICTHARAHTHTHEQTHSISLSLPPVANPSPTLCLFFFSLSLPLSFSLSLYLSLT